MMRLKKNEIKVKNWFADSMKFGICDLLYLQKITEMVECVGKASFGNIYLLSRIVIISGVLMLRKHLYYTFVVYLYIDKCEKKWVFPLTVLNCTT